MLDGLFDEYSLKARVNPALLVLLPVFVVVAVWFPSLYEFGTAIAGLFVSCGAVAILAHFARERGKKIEPGLWSQWGGAPATMALHHSDSLIEDHLKNRYHKFLETKIPNWRAPSPEEEIENPKHSFQTYNSAIGWLKERTRDSKRFPLVFAENINYGFRRNVLGLKTIGIIFSFGSVLFNLWFCYRAVCSQGVAATIISFFFMFWWIAVVKDSWVKKSADEYSDKLLASCDLLAD